MFQETLTYEADGLAMKSQLFLEPAPGPRAGVLVFPQAFGLGDNAIRRAKRLAGLGYIALACDLHGHGPWRWSSPCSTIRFAHGRVPLRRCKL